ncbi:MAG TPA: hypothetical protein VGB85_30065, partial [Nannocystis sp.]
PAPAPAPAPTPKPATATQATPATPVVKPKPAPKPTPAPEPPGATEDPPPLVKPGPDARPPLDTAAAAEVVRAATARIRRCAAEQAMVGNFTLQVKVDRQGKATGVDAAASSRKIPAEALACMRDVIAGESFQASARGGVVSVTLSAK